jgi:acetolactate decarboxylase
MNSLLAAAALLALNATTHAKSPATSSTLDLAKDTVTQVSSYNALLAGLFDGVVSYEELKPFGNFGLGTFDRLNGEMVMLDGVLYQIAFDGKVSVMPDESMTPYATLTNFEADQEIEIPEGLSYDEVSALIESQLPNPNLFYAIRIEGEFEPIKCRSVPKQKTPTVTIAEIIAGQSIFEAGRVKGTLVGFHYPKYASAFNPPGFHLHFLSDDRQFGGHALGFTTGSGVVAKIDRCTKLVVDIPDTQAARKADLSLDRSAEVNTVNRSK